MSSNFEQYRQTPRQMAVKARSINASPIRQFLSGHPVSRNTAIDTFVWLATTGYSRMQVSGAVPPSIVNRQERPSRSLEKFLNQNLSLFFRTDLKQGFLQQKYIQFTNEMTADDAHLLALASKGDIEFDIKQLEAYAGERQFPTGAYIFQRELYLELQAEKAQGGKPADPVVPVAVVPPAPEEPQKSADQTDSKSEVKTDNSGEGQKESSDPLLSEKSLLNDDSGNGKVDDGQELQEKSEEEAPRRRGGRRKKQEG